MSCARSGEAGLRSDTARPQTERHKESVTSAGLVMSSLIAAIWLARKGLSFIPESSASTSRLSSCKTSMNWHHIEIIIVVDESSCCHSEELLFSATTQRQPFRFQRILVKTTRVPSQAEKTTSSRACSDRRLFFSRCVSPASAAYV